MKLVNATELNNNLEDIADLLREKTGTTTQLTFPNDFITEINKIYTVDDLAMRNFSGIIYLPTATEIAPGTFAGSNITEIHAPNVTRFYSNVQNTGKSVFQNCKSLTVVDMPNFTSMYSGGYQFAGCTALTQIVLPKGNLGTYMFNGCSKLVIARLGGTSSMNGSGFRNCTSLTGLDLAISDTNGNEFYGCSKLTTLILRRTAGITSLSSTNNFTGTPFASGGTGGTLYVPAALKTTYENATNWSTILSYENNSIKAIEDSIYATQYLDGALIGG